MLIVNQIENTHFSKTEKEIVDYIIDQGMNIEKMSANEIARNTFTSAPLLVRIAKKLGYSGFNEFKSAYLKELSYMLEETDVDASIPFLLSDDLMTITKKSCFIRKKKPFKIHSNLIIMMIYKKRFAYYKKHKLLMFMVFSIMFY